MKTIFYKKVSVLIILSAFTILGACNKQTSLTSSDNNNNYTPVKNSEVLFSKMESYTPILINRGTKAFIDDIEKGIAIDPKKYENLFSDILEKVEQEGIINSFDNSQKIFKPLFNIFNKNTYIFDQEPLEDTSLSFLDKNIIALIQKVDDKEKASVAFYGSLLKSIIIYYVNNKILVEAKSKLLEQYQLKDGTYTIIHSGCGWERFKCRMEKIREGFEKASEEASVHDAIIDIIQSTYKGDCSKANICK